MTPLRALVTRSAVWLTCLWLPFAVAGSAAAQQKQPPLEELLKRLLREQQEGQTVPGGGTIRDARLRGGSGATVELEVELTGVTQPDRAALEATLYNARLDRVDAVAVEHDPIPAGDSTVILRLSYSGTGVVTTSAARVALIDSSSGKRWSVHRLALARQLSGTGAATDTVAGGASPGKTIDLAPHPVGDTPPPGGPGVSPAVAAAGRFQQKPIAAPKSEVAGARPAGAAIPVLNLYAIASQARWASGAGALPFNGPDSDSRGFVRALGQKTLADGAVHEPVLMTHPDWTAGGHIAGTYEVTIPAGATAFSAKVGFLPGATASDGVTVRATLREPGRIHRLVSRYLDPAEGVADLTATIPEAWRNKAVTLELRVDAGASATQDWLVWVAPAIR
jgi:hypothetical protein